MSHNSKTERERFRRLVVVKFVQRLCGILAFEIFSRPNLD